jgi:hypothetical protein
MLLPRRPSRNSFLDYVDKQEMMRIERDANQLAETKDGVSVAPAPRLRGPIVARKISTSRELRRSQRARRRPDRYGS